MTVMHVCLFDIDGTLLRSGGAGQAAMEAALKSEFGVELPNQTVSLAGRTDRAIIVDYMTHHGIVEETDTWSRFMRAYLDRLPGFLQRVEGVVLPGIASLLESLGSRDDVILGLLTGNFREGARKKLSHFGLYHHFRLGGYGDDHLDRDDVARDALAETQQRCNGSVDLDRVWVIGDTPADVRCARAISAKAVAVATGVFSWEELEATQPDHLFRDFEQPDRFLDLLAPTPP
jgi:phosphoglycolate phosphatase